MEWLPAGGGGPPPWLAWVFARAPQASGFRDGLRRALATPRGRPRIVAITAPAGSEPLALVRRLALIELPGLAGAATGRYAPGRLTRCPWPERPGRGEEDSLWYPFGNLQGELGRWIRRHGRRRSTGNREPGLPPAVLSACLDAAPFVASWVVEVPPGTRKMVRQRLLGELFERLARVADASRAGRAHLFVVRRREAPAGSEQQALRDLTPFESNRLEMTALEPLGPVGSADLEDWPHAARAAAPAAAGTVDWERASARARQAIACSPNGELSLATLEPHLRMGLREAGRARPAVALR